MGSDVHGGDGVEVQNVAGGRYAVATHCGSYAKLAETYGGLMNEWLPANRLAPRSTFRSGDDGLRERVTGRAHERSHPGRFAC